jgi:hypothetical protein
VVVVADVAPHTGVTHQLGHVAAGGAITVVGKIISNSFAKRGCVPDVGDRPVHAAKAWTSWSPTAVSFWSKK